MLNKFIFSILIAILLSNNPLRAMENPGMGMIQNLQVDESTKASKVKTVDLLKLIAARKVDELIMNGTISGLSLDNLPEELREYCMITINDYCVFLEQFNGITGKGLDDYKKLLCELYKKQGKAVGVILSTIVIYVPCQIYPQIYCFINLEEIKTLLGMLIRSSASENIVLTEQELDCRNKIIIHAIKNNKIELCQLLISNNLLPSLDDRVKIDNVTCSFFKHLVRLTSNNINFFNVILNEEKNKNYNWEMLFDKEAISILGREELSNNIVQIAATEICNDAILKLVKEKGLLENYINLLNEFGDTPLTKAAFSKNVEAVKFLIENGADINLKGYFGRTALQYAKSELETCELLLTGEQDDDYWENYEYWEKGKQRAAKCIELLEEASNSTNV